LTLASITLTNEKHIQHWEGMEKSSKMLSIVSVGHVIIRL